MLNKLSNTPLFLASVLNCNEAETALRGGAQIIDCKNSL
ncbi:MAG: (5-formylfuran-3-yl)methyl phosphate synthase, partial [Hyphomicrobium sp.]